MIEYGNSGVCVDIDVRYVWKLLGQKRHRDAEDVKLIEISQLTFVAVVSHPSATALANILRFVSVEKHSLALVTCLHIIIILTLGCPQIDSL